jgi:hypothetical protein
MRRVLLLLALLIGAPASAAPIGGEEARRILQQDGRLLDVEVEGDLDLDGLAHPSGTLALQGVRLGGSLRGAPAAALEIVHAALGGWRAPRAVFAHPVLLERTRIAGRVGLDEARFAQGLACRRCRFAGGVSARRARFEGEGADLSFSDFASIADFSAARFAAAAFDGVRFHGEAGPVFNDASFAGPAQFNGVATGAAPARFLGATFRDEVSFRGCRIGRAVFSVANGAAETPFGLAVAAFAKTADFRLCRFGSGVDLAGAALRGGATFADAALDAGVLDLRRLTTLGGEIVLRGIVLGPAARIAVDATGIQGLVAEPARFEPAGWPGQDAQTLDALAARAKAQGAETGSRRLAFAATQARAAAPGAAWDDRAALALAWPTRNATDLLRPLLLAALAWLAALLLTLPRGALAQLPPAKEPGGVLARVLGPTYLPMSAEEARGAHRPGGVAERIGAAASFGLALVFRLGSQRWRPLPGAAWRTVTLALLWLAGTLLGALILATALRLFPDLQILTGALG